MQYLKYDQSIIQCVTCFTTASPNNYFDIFSYLHLQGNKNETKEVIYLLKGAQDLKWKKKGF